MGIPEEKHLVEPALREISDKRMYERYLAVLHRLEGRTIKDISKMIKRTEKTTAGYIHSYEREELEGLSLGHSPGKPHRLMDEQERILANTVANKRPVDVGIEAKYTWTLKLAMLFVEREFGECYTEKGMSVLLHRLGLSHTKATYTMELANPEEQHTFTSKTFPALKKLMKQEIEHLLFEDECMIRAYQSLQYSWFPVGAQRRIPTYGRHEGAKLFGALNYETGQVLYRDGERYDTSAFIQFLDVVLKAYPTGKRVMILDNGRIHHAAEVRNYLKQHTRLQFVFLPKYPPDLNLIEGLWKWLKSDVVHNVFYKKFYHIRINVAAFMKRVNKKPVEVIDRLCIRM
ncbi:transposase [Paenibacillus yonginensis]|uniref:Transposase n=1 Tax=Paenibacillus yonginensis TaxID=1462996 RepID=A0A1B1MVH1_9BACL|nr:IS630 family transposase [Paenibacillus yonginensis]ANS73181.1 transposase [Paenibacillus yonginensis]